MAELSAEEQAKIAKQIERQNKALAKQIAQEEELKKLQGERLRQIDKDIEASEKQVEHATDRLNLIAQASQLNEEARQARVEELKAQFESLKLKHEEGKLTKEEIAEKTRNFQLNKSILESTNEELEAKRDLAEIEKERVKTLDKQKKAAKEIGEAMKDMVSSSTGISDAWKTRQGLAGSFTRSVEAGGSLSTTLGEIGNGIKEAINPTNFLASAFLGVVDSTKELFFEMDQVLAEFKRGTGLSKEYSDSLLDVRQNQVHLGYGMRDVAEQFDAITSANSAFVFQNKATRESLQNNVAAMGMAFDASTEFAEGVGFATTALGLAPAEAEATTRGLASFAKAIKASPKEMMRDYAALGPRLAAWGDKATDVFKETAAAAKALNMETSEMLDIAGQFDTFDEAAEHVGQLNAMLGGDYFDTVEMVNASESKRIELLMEGVRATGKSWDSLGRFERKAIATAAGITDMAQANKMFGQGLDVYKELQSHTDDASMSYNDLSEAAKENMSIQEKVSAITKSLAISFGWVIESIATALGWLQSAASFFGAAWPYVVLGIGVAIVALTKFTSVLSFVSKPIGMLTGALKRVAPGFQSAGASASESLRSFKGFFKALSDNYKGILSFGAAMLMVGAGIAVASLGLAELVSSFGALGDSTTAIAAAFGSIVVLVGGFALMAWLLVPAIIALGASSAAAALPLLAVGGAFFLIGAGIAVAAYGISLLIGSFTDLSNSIVPALATIKTLSSVNFGDVASGIDDVAEAVGSLNDELADIEIEKLMGLVGLGTVRAPSIRSTVPGPSLKPTAATNKIIRTSSEINTYQNLNRFQTQAAQERQQSQTMAQATPPLRQTTPPSSQAPPLRPQEVILEIDGKKFAKLVIDPYLEGRLRPKLTV